jgi:hypothetical protein
MRREESSANPEKRPGHDDANADPGNGASGPGEPGDRGDTNISDGGEGLVDIEEKAAAGVDPAAPHLQDRVTEDPATQADA